MKTSNCPEISDFIQWVCINCTERLLFKASIVENIFDENRKYWYTWNFNQRYFNHNVEDYIEYVKSDSYGICSTKTLYETWYEAQNNPELTTIEFKQWMDDTFIPVNFLDYLVTNQYWLCRSTNNNGSGKTEEFWVKGIKRPKGRYTLEKIYQEFLKIK
jgi:hypothetical protein